MSALARFQTKLGVYADGIIGPSTVKAARDYLVLTNNQAAHFFAQCHHETAGFKRFTENLNYSVLGLRTTFPRYFPTYDIAAPYARRPEKIANYIYGGRMGNNRDGDGWLYRGRGALQLTGRDNYRLFANSALAFKDALAMPELVESQFAFESAAHFFDKNRIWDIAKLGIGDDIITQVRRKVNGGIIGLKDCQILTARYAAWLR